MNLEKLSAAQKESSGHDPDLVDASDVKRILEGVKEHCDILKKSLVVLPTDATTTVSATASSTRDHIDSLKAIIQDSFDRLRQESESVNNCWRLQKVAKNSGEDVAMYSPGRPQQLKSERVMRDMQSLKQMMNTGIPESPKQKQQSADNVVLTLQPDSRARIDSATQQPIEQCKEVAEASVIELPPQTASKNASRASSSCLSRPMPSLHALVAAASPPAPKAQSSSAGAWSPSCTHQAVPASQTPREHVMCRNPSNECVQGALAIQTPREHFLTRSSSKERVVPASSSARPRITWSHSGARRSPSLDAQSSVPWPLPPQQQQLQQQQQLPQQTPQEQKAQPLERPAGPATSPATAIMARENSRDVQVSWASPSPTPSTATTIAAQLVQAALPVGTPQMQSPREFPRDTVRACGVRSPSMDPSYAQILVQPPQRMRGSLGGSLGLRARR